MTDDAHARPSGQAEEALYDLSIATPSHAERARSLVAQLSTGTLCTLTDDPAGYPYGSFVTFALDGPDPVFLISGLAEHTKNLKRDSRASLLVAENVAADPLANGRVTLLGPCERVVEAEAGSCRNAFLAVHPGAAYYVDFKDFAFWRLRTESVRYIGGYGRMSWVDCQGWRDARPDPLAVHAAGIVQHMNDDHRDAMVLLCRAFSRADDAEEVTMVGIDRYGFEMSVVTAAGSRPVRIAFAEQVGDPVQARKAIVALVGEARSRLFD